MCPPGFPVRLFFHYFLGIFLPARLCPELQCLIAHTAGERLKRGWPDGGSEFWILFNFQISLVVSSLTCWLFRTVLFNSYILVNFPNFLFLREFLLLLWTNFFFNRDLIFYNTASIFCLQALWDLSFPKGSNLHPLHWKLRVLTTVPPGKSLKFPSLIDF